MEIEAHQAGARLLVIAKVTSPRRGWRTPEAAAGTEAKYRKFVVKWLVRLGRGGGHSHARGIYYDGGPSSSSGTRWPINPRSFGLCGWVAGAKNCSKVVREIRRDVAQSAQEDTEYKAKVAAEFEANRYKPLN